MYLLVQLQVSELMLKDILALMSLGVKLNFKKNATSGFVFTLCFMWS